ncbi:hypothetical protein L204_100855 [Cryptococcus depauperatus]|nr:hypothetical protein L204_01212 [Cryptococcus depauperatus CBS 7855]
MAGLPLISRSCRASSSRFTLVSRSEARSLSFFPSQMPSSVPFYVPQFGLRLRHGSYMGYGEKGKRREPPDGGRGIDPEENVDDREWDMRVARAVLHLQETLPHFFNSEMTTGIMLPPDIYSPNMVLKLPAPLPLKISSLPGYSMAFSLTRSGMQALHINLRSDLERMTFSPSPSDLAKEDKKAALLIAKQKVPTHRLKQIRVLVSVYGKLRLPPHTETKWHTSSLYTFHPASGLILSHVVETIRPLPGEGVAQWLMSRLLGWSSTHNGEGAIPCPRAVTLPPETRVARFEKRENKEN